MKQSPNNRIPPHGGKRAGRRQARIKSNTAPRRDPASWQATGPVTVVFRTHRGKELERVKLAGGLFVLLEQAAKRAGITPAEFLEAAMMDQYRRIAVVTQTVCENYLDARALPPWLTQQRLSLLQALNGNKSRHSLSCFDLAKQVRACGVDLTPGNDSDLVFMAEIGLVADQGHNEWRITAIGRAALAGFHSKITPHTTQGGAR